MLAACFNADMVTEITLQPVRRHGVDAAILFSDIVVPLKAAGVDVTIVSGVGPVVAAPITSAAGVDAIGELAGVDQIETAVKQLTNELGDVPLIGFCGAPFTLASYLIEGGPSRDHAATKAMMWSQPDLWDQLLSRLAEVCGQFLRLQIQAGASAIQVFDSWAGALTRHDYEQRVRPHTQRLLASIADLDVPRIHFGVGTGELLHSMAVPECEVVGIDHRVDLADGIARIGSDHAVQGNLDPAALFADWAVIEAAAEHILAAAGSAQGHIFNLGHGVLPTTDPGVLTRLVEWLHARSATESGMVSV